MFAKSRFQVLVIAIAFSILSCGRSSESTSSPLSSTVSVNLQKVDKKVTGSLSSSNDRASLSGVFNAPVCP